MTTTTTTTVTTDCTVICDIDHEEGDFTDYTSHIDDADLTVAAGAALAGTNYGLSCNIADDTAIYGVKNLSEGNTGVIRARFYLDPNGVTMPDGDVVNIITGYNTVAILTVALIYVTAASSRKLRLGYKGAGGWVYTSVVGTAGNITDDPHYVEFMMTRASGDTVADGTLTWWVDGVSKNTPAAIDNYDEFNDFTQIRMGLVVWPTFTTSTGTIFMDELIVKNTSYEIGP